MQYIDYNATYFDVSCKLLLFCRCESTNLHIYENIIFAQITNISMHELKWSKQIFKIKIKC